MKNKETIAVSVVVPTLNERENTRNCLASIAGQTLKNIEILCVDAGSTDGTQAILEEYVKTDARFHLILSTKQSYGYQVNIGFAKAHGEYVGIVEADDTVSAEMFERLYETATENDAEFVKADYDEVFEGQNGKRNRRHRSVLSDETLYEQPLCIAEHPQCFLPDVIATWSGIYRKDFLDDNGIRHNETAGASFQDTGFWIQTYLYAKKAFFLREALYEYRIDNPKSSTFRADKWRCVNDEFSFAMGAIKRTEPSEKNLSRLYRIFYRKYRRNVERVPKEELAEFYGRFREDFRLWKEWFPDTEQTDFYDEEKEDLERILANGRDYAEAIRDDVNKFQKSVEAFDAILLYGSGRVGKMVYEELKDGANILGFADSTTISEYAKNEAIRKDALVVIASKISEYRNEMEARATKEGFRNIARVPYGAY